MNGKSQTKKVLTVSKTKFQIDNVYKKHKSQESYSDLKTISTQMPLKSSKSKQNLSPKNNTKYSFNANTNKITNVKIKNVMNMININTTGNTSTSANFTGLNINSSNSPVANIVSFNNIFNSGNCSTNDNNNKMNICDNNALNNCNNSKPDINSNLNKFGNSKSEKKVFNSNLKNNLQNILNNNYINNINNSNAKENSGNVNNTNTTSKINLNNLNLTNSNIHSLLLNSNSKSKLEKNSEKNFIKNTNSLNIIKNNQTNNINANILNYHSAAVQQKNNLMSQKQTIFSQDCAKIIDTEENEEDLPFDSQTPEKYQKFSNNINPNIPKENINETYKSLMGIKCKSIFTKTNNLNYNNIVNNNNNNNNNDLNLNSNLNNNKLNNTQAFNIYSSANNNLNNSNIKKIILESETPNTKRCLNSKSPYQNNANFASKSNRKQENSGNNSIDEYDEMRSNCHLRDFYTNSIGEASCSLIDKGEGIINNIPNTFVRQSENKLIVQKNSKPYMDLSYHNNDDKSTSNFNNNTALNQTNSVSNLNNFTPHNPLRNNNNNHKNNNNNKENYISNSKGNCSELNLDLDVSPQNCFAKISSADDVTNINDCSEILEKSNSNNNIVNNNKNDFNYKNLNKSGSDNQAGLNNLSKLKSEKNMDLIGTESLNLQTQPSKVLLNSNADKNQIGSEKDNSMNSNSTAKINSQKKANMAVSRFSNKNENKNLNKIFDKISNSNIGNIKHLATSNSNNIFNTNFDFKKYMVDSKPRNTNVKRNLNCQSNSNLNLNLNNNSMNHLDILKNDVFHTHENNISPVNRVGNNNCKEISNTNISAPGKNKLIIKNIQHNNPNGSGLGTGARTNAINLISNSNNSKTKNSNKIINNNVNGTNNNSNNNDNDKINKSNYTSNRESTNLLSSVELVPAEKNIAYPAQFSSRETALHDAKPLINQNSKTQINSNPNQNINQVINSNQNINPNQPQGGSASHNVSSSSSTASSNAKEESLIIKLYTKLLICAKKGDRDAFLETLSHIYKLEGNRTNISFKDENGWTALHYAADEGNFKIIEILMKMNVDSNIRTLAKKSALHLSAEKGYFDVSRMLIENGALLSLLDDEKNSPIHLSAQKGHLELLKYFLEKFPQADTKNIYGKTPLDLAANDKIKELLLEFLNKKSYNFHKITIHTANSKKVDEFLSNIKDKKTQTQNLETFSTLNNDFIKNNNGKNKNNFNDNCDTNINKSKISNSNRADSSKKIVELKENDIDKNYKTENLNNNNLNTSNNNDYRNYASNINSNSNNLNFLEKSSGSGSSLRTSSVNPVNNSNDNLKFKSVRSGEHHYSEEHSAGSNLEHFSSYEEERIGPSSFICHALLGKGSFGEVYLVEKRDTKIFYAMKVLSKDKIMAQNLVKYAMTERNVLSITNHPFIVKLNYSFQSSDKLFLILDYCPGGDLAEHLSNEKRFSEERAKIYLCEIILALEDLHKRDIIFRDLKPDNVVLDYEGHAMLTDFGLSKEGVYDNKGAKSFCGSIAYLAPEMLKRSGHGKSVDWYLLGVLFYEMLVGLPPFFNTNKDQLFKNIETQELQYPKYIGESAGNLLRALLNKDPYTRLGAGKNDAEDVKSHAYFKDVNWDDVHERPPIPVLKNKYIELLKTPKIFEEGENNDDFTNDSSNKYFDNWSFVKNNNINNN